MSLISSGAGEPGFGTENIVPQLITKMHRSGDLHLGEDHEVKPDKLNPLDRLC